MPSVVWSVQMHNVLKIGLVVRREPLTITPLVEGCTDLKNIVHFHSMRVTNFCIRGGGIDVEYLKRHLHIKSLAEHLPLIIINTS